MSRQDIRRYEISLWSLQDTFINVLSSSDVAHKGQAINPMMALSIDGTQTFSFSVPIKYYEGNQLVDNPKWYNEINGTLIAGLRKIKVIFHKGETREQIYEFIINKVTERHEESQLFCDVECDGLAFNELGKTGYKLEFSSETYEAEYEAALAEDPAATLPATLNYWMDKIVEGTNWTYEVDMDWSGYAENRLTNKVYEDMHVTSWDNNLDPMEVSSLKEKERILTASKSNRYNITQDIAELFEIYCRYEYSYDVNYHITGRKIIFYNNIITEDEAILDFQYPYTISNISREMDSHDVTTKLYVVPVDDESQPSGQITIADEPANKLQEDYLLNFNYLYNIGTITDEQYAAVARYENKIGKINKQLVPKQKKANTIQAQLPDKEGLKVSYQNQIDQAIEVQDDAQASLNALINNDDTIAYTRTNPQTVALLKDENDPSLGYINIGIHDKGVLQNSLRYFKNYGQHKKNGEMITEVYGEVNLSGYQIGYEYEDADLGGYLSRIYNIPLNLFGGEGTIYLLYEYEPKLQYESIIKTYQQKQQQLEKKLKKVTKEITDLKNKLNDATTGLLPQIEDLIAQKKILTTQFEKMMGPALKEGSWQAETYTDYGNNFYETFEFQTEKQNNNWANKYTNFKTTWDDTPIEGELLPTYNVGVVETNTPYPTIDIDSNNCVADNIRASLISFIKKNIDELTLYYKDSTTPSVPFNRVKINSGVFYTFFSKDNNIHRVLLITDEDFITALTGHTLTLKLGSDNIKGTKFQVNLVQNHTDYTMRYPRLEFTTEKLKTSESMLRMSHGDAALDKYNDYALVYKDTAIPFITLKDEVLFLYGYSDYSINYMLSTASLSIYLDALKVLQENSIPQVSYNVTVAPIKENWLSKLYSYLGHIIHINDTELHFEYVRGYVYSVSLNLDEPWQDTVEIKNYKTKFEDLFARIVASSEQMKLNEVSYNKAASAFNADGSLSESALQRSLSQGKLNYKFNQGNLTIDEENGIWGISSEGVVAYRGGGIFTANSKDNEGNWQWNSALTPAGLNAKLITTGQLDTERIKIYAGDNPALQMNKYGLFAYKVNDDAIDQDTYVVHNGNGLFLTEKQTDNTMVNRVEVSWDGLVLRNKNNQEVFKADDDTGDLLLTGTITANAGEIGGWSIDDSQLSSQLEVRQEGGEQVLALINAGMNSQGTGSNNDSEDDLIFWVNRHYENSTPDEYFYVKKSGVTQISTLSAYNLTANNAIIAGLDIASLAGDMKKVTVISHLGNVFMPTNGLTTLEYTISPVGLNITTGGIRTSIPSTATDEGYVIEYRTDFTESAPWIIADDDDEFIDFTPNVPNNLNFSVNSAIVGTGDRAQIRIRAYEPTPSGGSGHQMYEADIITVIYSESGDLYASMIESSNGDVFSYENVTTTLKCRIWKSGNEVDSEGTDVTYSYKWYKDNNFNVVIGTAKTLEVTDGDVNKKATYTCEVSINE